MAAQPSLETERLILRPFKMEDARELKELISERDIAYNTLNIPHPYTLDDAVAWLSTRQEDFEIGRVIAFAVTLKDSGEIIGGVSLVSTNNDHKRSELGYWIGKPYWNKGYATEASVAMLKYGFRELRLNRIQAGYFSRNEASGKVMEKIGMTYEGCWRQYVKKWGEYLDLKYYSILRSEFDKIYPAK